MPTTRPRVNLTLTEMEQYFLEEIVTEGTVEYEMYMDHRRRSGFDVASAPALADVVHVLLELGLQRLHEEAAEISYAAEAAAETGAGLGIGAARHRRHVESAVRAENG
jgi:pantoate kinase